MVSVVSETFSRAEAATFIERYAERLANGPAPRDFGYPINRHLHDPEAASAVRTALYSVAQAVRAGVDQPENDWPASLVAELIDALANFVDGRVISYGEALEQARRVLAKARAA